MAPELLQEVDLLSGEFKYDEKVDIWAIGVMTYYLLQDGKFPFPGKKKADV